MSLCIVLVFGINLTLAAVDVVPNNLGSVEKKAQKVYANYDSQQVNGSLKHLAVFFARLINEDPEMREFIGLEVGKKFDGDYDSLFELIADVQYKGRTLRSCLNGIVKQHGKDLNSL